MPDETLNFRDRVKFACLRKCVEAGLDESEMVVLFRNATNSVKNGTSKTAFWGNSLLAPVKPTVQGLGILAAWGIPVTALGSAVLGNIAGRTAGNIEIGRLPSTEEIKLLDDIAAYRRAAAEVQSRTEEAEAEKKRRSKPSVRRMF